MVVAQRASVRRAESSAALGFSEGPWLSWSCPEWRPLGRGPRTAAPCPASRPSHPDAGGRSLDGTLAQPHLTQLVRPGGSTARSRRPSPAGSSAEEAAGAADLRAERCVQGGSPGRLVGSHRPRSGHTRDGAMESGTEAGLVTCGREAVATVLLAHRPSAERKGGREGGGLGPRARVPAQVSWAAPLLVGAGQPRRCLLGWRKGWEGAAASRRLAHAPAPGAVHRGPQVDRRGSPDHGSAGHRGQEPPSPWALGQADLVTLSPLGGWVRPGGGPSCTAQPGTMSPLPLTVVKPRLHTGPLGGWRPAVTCILGTLKLPGVWPRLTWLGPLPPLPGPRPQPRPVLFG